MKDYNKYTKKELIKFLTSRDANIAKQANAIRRRTDLINLSNRRLKVIMRQLYDIVEHPYSKEGYRTKTKGKFYTRYKQRDNTQNDI